MSMPPPIPNLDTAYNLLISTAAPTRDARRNVVTPTPPNSIIACLESHLCPILPVGTFSSTGPSHAALHLISTPVLSKLKDLGPARVEDMRSLGQTRQIVSHVPILTNPAACVKLNDTTYTSIQQNGDKFSALASLPCAAGEGKAAARELQRCITKMRFVGGVFVLGRDNSDALLDTSFNELWNMAEKFRMPIALREAWPCGAELPVYQGNLANTVLAPLATHLNTSHNSSPLPIIQFYLSGVFDRHPNLRFILSHPGLLPSLIPRIETLLERIPGADKPKRGFLDVWQHNFYLTTADVLDMSTMRTLLEQIPMDRVMYASNYPLEERGRELMDELKESAFLTKEEWERIAWANAEALLGLKNGRVTGGTKIP